jgi:hypothetical protein
VLGHRLPREGEDTIGEELGGVDLVGESDRPRAPRVERSPAQDQVESAAHAHDLRQALRAAPRRQDAEPHLWEGDASRGAIAHEPVMASEGELGAAAETHAVDRGHDRQAKGLDLGEHPLPEARGLHTLLLAAHAGDRLDIGGDEAVGRRRAMTASRRSLYSSSRSWSSGHLEGAMFPFRSG